MSDFSYNLESLLAASQRFFVLTGCSGGGKSALAEALGNQGVQVFPEPGRQIVREQQFMDGDALPQTQPLQFAALCVSRAISQRIEAARDPRIAVFDRGLVDPIAHLDHLGLPIPVWLDNAAKRIPHNRVVFAVPPWREIFEQDRERQYSFEQAAEQYPVLLAAYRRYGHEVIELERLPVTKRAEFVRGLIHEKVLLH
jgi:predicted ATPase